MSMSTAFRVVHAGIGVLGAVLYGRSGRSVGNATMVLTWQKHTYQHCQFATLLRLNSNSW
jgi:hypothetical protein